MHKVLKPDFINAVVPILFRNLLKSLFVTIIFYGVILLLKNYIKITDNQILFLLITIVLIILLPSLLHNFIIHKFTKYYFYASHITSEFKFIAIKRQSVPYHQIVNMKTNISLWDRISKCGDIVLYTAEDKSPELILRYIKDPEKVESYLFQLTQKDKQGHHTSQRKS